MSPNVDERADAIVEELAQTHALNPMTGALFELAPATPEELADEVDWVKAKVAELADYRQQITDELAKRADRKNARKLKLTDGREVEVNAPTEDEWAVDEVRAALRRLIDAEVLDAEVLDTIVVYPTPSKPPPPRVHKVELKKLLGNPDVAAELTPIRRTLDVKRTASVKAPKKKEATDA